MRKAVPDDLKSSPVSLKIGQPYAIIKDGEDTASGLFVLDGSEDAFALKLFLDRGEIYVPVMDWQLEKFLKIQENQDV